VYENGIETEDPEEKRSWLRWAATEGYIPAMYESERVTEGRDSA
jgi:hypothetical protein